MSAQQNVVDACDPAAKFRNWHRRDDWHWRRECGRFQICRSLSFDFHKNGSWIYHAWHLAPFAGEQSKPINDQPLHSFDAAVSAVREYAQSLPQQSAASTATEGE